MGKHSFASTFSGQVDRAAGIIRGVAVITAGPALGHGVEIDAITLAQVCKTAQEYSGGLKVVDRHTKSSDSVFSTTGMLRNFRVEDGKVKADLHLLDSETNREKLMEMAEKIPDTFGLSIAFSGPSEDRDGKSFARCTEIFNAALVDQPAANPSGLFSAIVDAPTDGNKSTMTPEDIMKQCEAKIASALVEFSARISSMETALAASKAAAELSAKNVTELSAKLEASTKELAAKIGDDKSRLELTAQTVAKEFSAHVGAGFKVPPQNAADGTNGGDAAPAIAFIELAKKKFGETNSKTKAMELAIGEDPKGYKAFRAANQDIKWTA